MFQWSFLFPITSKLSTISILSAEPLDSNLAAYTTPLALISPSTCNVFTGSVVPIPTAVAVWVVLIVNLSTCVESLSYVLILKSLLDDASKSILALSTVP